MITTDQTDFLQAIAALQREGKLPSFIPARQLQLLRLSFEKYAGEIGQKLVDDILSDFSDQMQKSLAGITTPGQRSEVLYNLISKVGADIGERLQFAMDVAQEVSAGAGRYLNQNLSQEAVDEYPALALQRYFPRQVPRGWKRLGKTIIPVPDDAWPARWAEAGARIGDQDWLPWSGDSQGGRGVALKSSGIWAALGSLRDDSLGNPFPPFAFNSGFMTQNLSRSEAEGLGLLKKGEKAAPAKIDFKNLFASIL